MSDPLPDCSALAFVQDTPVLLDFMEKQLDNENLIWAPDNVNLPKWNVYQAETTSFDDIQQRLHTYNFPLALIFYNGSEWENDPRRNASISVLIGVQDSSASPGFKLCQRYMDQCILALDRYIPTGAKALWKVASDQSIDFQAGYSFIKIDYIVEDR